MAIVGLWCYVCTHLGLQSPGKQKPNSDNLDSRAPGKGTVGTMLPYQQLATQGRYLRRQDRRAMSPSMTTSQLLKKLHQRRRTLSLDQPKKQKRLSIK